MKRRNFLINSGIIGTGLALGPTYISSCTNTSKKEKIYTGEDLGIFSFREKAPEGKHLNAALIGCGGRGTGATMQFLKVGPDVSLVALADIFPEKVINRRKKFKAECNIDIPENRCFVGFDAYKKVLDLSDVDVVLLCTPPHFRPEHFAAAVNAGKHVFMEKPCAVDPVGVRSVLASAKQAKNKGLTVITGTQRRHRLDYWEAYIAVKNGIIGDLTHASASWTQGPWWNKFRRPEWSDMEYCMRNWYNIIWVCGDHILDQNTHNIDVVTWFFGEKPQKAIGYGGRARRLSGDIYDFFSVFYYYQNNKRMSATVRQIQGCAGEIGEKIYGTKGVAILSEDNDIHIEDYNGNILWKYDYDKKPVKDAYVQEHVHLIESIRLHKTINQAEDLAYSTLIAIQGREAAYTGKEISWDEILLSPLRYGPKEYNMDAKVPEFKEGVCPIPGVDI